MIKSIIVKIPDVPDGNGRIFTKDCLQKIAERTNPVGLKVLDSNSEDASIIGEVTELKFDEKDNQLKADLAIHPGVTGKLYPCVQGEVVSKLKKDGVTHVKYFSLEAVSLCANSADPGVDPIEI